MQSIFLQNDLHKILYKQKYALHTHTDCSRNWVLILVRMEILWEEEGFQFGFKRWQGWAVSQVLWEWIPNAGSKAREDAKVMSLAFVSLDFSLHTVGGKFSAIESTKLRKTWRESGFLEAIFLKSQTEAQCFKYPPNQEVGKILKPILLHVTTSKDVV